MMELFGNEYVALPIKIGFGIHPTWLEKFYVKVEYPGYVTPPSPVPTPPPPTPPGGTPVPPVG
jgi:hypothetical protein